jgi:hypothetical protein
MSELKAVIEAAVPLALLFLLFGITCEVWLEFLEIFLKRRAIFLREGIIQLFGGDSKAFMELFYLHALINPLYRGTYPDVQRGRLPSYIPARNFALALIDLRSSDIALPENVKQAFRTFVLVAGPNILVLQWMLENWYNAAMDRISGRYKRQSQLILFFYGLLLSVVLNFDVLAISSRLFTLSNESLHKQTAEIINSAASSPAAANATGRSNNRVMDARDALELIDRLGIPLGWGLEEKRSAIQEVKLHFVGWSMSAIIICLIAPLVFDTLNRFTIIRSTVKPYEPRWSPPTTIPQSPDRRNQDD